MPGYKGLDHGKAEADGGEGAGEGAGEGEGEGEGAGAGAGKGKEKEGEGEGGPKEVAMGEAAASLGAANDGMDLEVRSRGGEGGGGRGGCLLLTPRQRFSPCALPPSLKHALHHPALTLSPPSRR